MNSTLGRLDRSGLIERTPHPMHGTLIEIRLTAQGREVFEAADARVAALDAALGADLSAVELKALKGLLAAVIATATDVTGSPAASTSAVTKR